MNSYFSKFAILSIFCIYKISFRFRFLFSNGQISGLTPFSYGRILSKTKSKLNLWSKRTIIGSPPPCPFFDFLSCVMKHGSVHAGLPFLSCAIFPLPTLLVRILENIETNRKIKEASPPGMCFFNVALLSLFHI